MRSSWQRWAGPTDRLEQLPRAVVEQAQIVVRTDSAAATHQAIAPRSTAWPSCTSSIPLARDAIMLGVNQGIIMVLAVVVIGGLVGSGALGDEIARGLQRNEFGQGVVASLAILALGIALDRVTQGNRRAREERGR